MFQEHEIGRIAPGMRADLVVLSGDLFNLPPEQIETVRVDLTIVNGKVTNERD
jgi:predicted amidohydrolase YtcJ